MTIQRPESDSGKSALFSAAHAQTLAKWLGSKSVAGRIFMVTEGLKLSLGSDGHQNDKQISIDVTHGKMVVETSQQDLERLLIVVGNEIAAEHGVVVQSASLKLKGLNPRQIDWFLNAKAKRGLFSAAVEVKGRLSITDQFEAHLTGLDIRGHGILGGVVAAFVRPRLKEVEGEKFPIAKLIPGNVQLKDVRFEIDERVRLIAHVDNSNLLLPRLTALLNDKQSGAENKTAGKPPAIRPGGKKQDIFIIDTGWNTKAKTVLDGHLVLFKSFLAEQNVFVLSESQSKEVLQRQPALIGADPIVMVMDSDPRLAPPGKGSGVRICMGEMKGDLVCMETLQRMRRMVAEGQAPGEPLQIVIDVVEAPATR